MTDITVEYDALSCGNESNNYCDFCVVKFLDVNNFLRIFLPWICLFSVVVIVAEIWPK